MKRIAILASGSGSNAENLVRWFRSEGRSAGEVAVMIADREAPVVERMRRLGVEALVIDRKTWRESPETVVDALRGRGVTFVVLAGFLSVVADAIIDAFPRRIVNLHPSLLPKYGGKGMWGERVHEAVIAAGERESGITVHYVSSAVDGGEIVAQFRCEVLPSDTPASLAERVHQLEHLHLPSVVASLPE